MANRDTSGDDEMNIVFRGGWVAADSHATWLRQELEAELGPGHTLKARQMRAIAYRPGCDDVLFVSEDEPRLVAVVHLTFSEIPEHDPRWPSTTFFISIDDWIKRGMYEDFTA